MGGNRVTGCRIGKEINTTNSNLFHNRFVFKQGQNNRVIVDENTILEWSKITIKGCNNYVYFGCESYLNGLNIIVEGDDNKVIFGDNSFVLGDTRIYVVDGSALEVGKGCMFSDRIEIRTTDNHSIIETKSGKRINPEENIILHDHVWIGTGVTILKGAEIAEGCIVGAASVVTRTYLMPNVAIAGNPARVVRQNVRWIMERI
jgi:acetyltransferase-like isoleucine patch superfamily enzyme